MERALLILDLDETVVWATEEEPPDGFDFRVSRYFVKKRPHLDTFLHAVRQWYELAVWSSSGDAYADQVVNHALGDPSVLRFVWGRSRCTERLDEENGERYFAKSLKKVKKKGFNLARVLIIDDTPEKARQNFGNHLGLRPFEGQSSDRELLDLLPFLEWLKDRENFRKIEKRGWRDVGLEPTVKAVGAALRGIGSMMIKSGCLDVAQKALETSLRFDPRSPVAENDLNYIRHLRKWGPEGKTALTETFGDSAPVCAKCGQDVERNKAGHVGNEGVVLCERCYDAFAEGAERQQPDDHL